MNILIVEDEQLTREGILSIIKKNYPYHTVVATEDGEKAIEISKRMPFDLIITDIQMPSMSGLQMIKEIRSSNSQVSVIILTGYPDFNYAKESISLKVDEYLLKPLKIEELMLSLKKIEQKDKNQIVHLKQPEELLLHLLTGTDIKEKKQIIEALNMVLRVNGQSKFFSILIRQKENCELVQQKSIEQIKLIFEMVLLEYILLVPLPFYFGILVISYKNTQRDYIKKIFERDILPNLQSITPSVAFCKTCNELIELESEIVQMRDMTKYALHFSNSYLIDEQMIINMNETPMYPINLESKAVQAIYQKDQDMFKITSEQFATFILKQKINYKNTIEMFNRFVACCYNKIKEITPLINDINIFLDFLDEPLQNRFIKAFLDKMSMLSTYIENVGSESVVIERTVKYIRANYKNEISLQQLADRVGVTPEYLSKLFYSKVGVHFSVFLRNIRITLAKDLLLSQNLQIREIAERSGFSDPKYFNRVFKETCGMSPSEFRKRNKE